MPNLIEMHVDGVLGEWIMAEARAAGQTAGDWVRDIIQVEYDLVQLRAAPRPRAKPRKRKRKVKDPSGNVMAVARRLVRLGAR